MEHISVMLDEAIDALKIKPNGIYVDGTLGRAGHSSEILKRLNKDGLLIAFDKDQEAIDKSQTKLSKIGSNFKLIHQGFENLASVLKELNIDKIDGLLLDIGVSSPQFDDGERGFSYRYDARLDMRMDQSQSLDAHYIVNEYDEKNLAKIFYEYGEEKFAKKIAHAIVQARKKKPIDTTFELVDIIKQALPAKVLNKKGHPAKQVFQSLRIEVNNELGALKEVLYAGLDHLNVNGRIAVITFHSLEDRIVKRIFNEYAKEDKVDKRLPMSEEERLGKAYRLVNRKVILASEEELANNKRAHSAKLRIIEKIR